MPEAYEIDCRKHKHRVYIQGLRLAKAIGLRRATARNCSDTSMYIPPYIRPAPDSTHIFGGEMRSIAVGISTIYFSAGRIPG